MRTSLTECQGKLITQENLSLTAQADVAELREELEKSQQEMERLHAENARLASMVNQSSSKKEQLSSAIR